MNTNTKTLIWVVVIIFLLGFASFYSQNLKDISSNINTPNPFPNSLLTGMKHFTDSAGELSLDYNSSFQVMEGSQTPTTNWKLNSKQSGIILASVLIPRAYMPDTNFSEAKLVIGRSSDAVAIKSCTVIDTASNEKADGTSGVSGFPFTKVTANDAGAGNFYETTSYRGIVDGDCYVVEYTIHSTNIGNYSPDQGIKEFDKAKVENELENIIKSLKFNVNSD